MGREMEMRLGQRTEKEEAKPQRNVQAKEKGNYGEGAGAKFVNHLGPKHLLGQLNPSLKLDDYATF